MRSTDHRDWPAGMAQGVDVPTIPGLPGLGSTACLHDCLLADSWPARQFVADFAPFWRPPPDLASFPTYLGFVASFQLRSSSRSFYHVERPRE